MVEVSSIIMLNDMASSFAATVKAKLSSQDRSQQVVTIGLLCAATLSILAPLDAMQLAFGLVGAVTYAGVHALFLQKVPPASHRKVYNTTIAPQRFGNRACVNRPAGNAARHDRRDVASSHVRRAAQGLQATTVNPAPVGIIKPEVRKPSSQPVTAPVFQSHGFNAEVDELINHISPTAEADRILQRITEFVKEKIQPILPDAEVTGFASGDLAGGTAFGVAVPDVDIVVSANPTSLVTQLMGKNRCNMSNASVDTKKLHKSAIRACTDALVSSGTIKFRRSCFRGEEPKVTLLVTTSFGVFDQAIPLDFSVNGVMALHNAALLMECGNMDPRAKHLILMVRRWAKYRGICHAAKGHLPPYAWSLLVIYFLQVSGRLPPFDEFESCSTLAMKQESKGKHRQPSEVKTSAARAQEQTSRPRWSPPINDHQQKAVGDLFKEFAHFYSKSFDLRQEHVSVQSGKRGPPGLSLPGVGSQSDTGPHIADPFNSGTKIVHYMTSLTRARLQEELTRAAELCGNGRSLTELLEPWAPPEQGHVDDEEPGEVA